MSNKLSGAAAFRDRARKYDEGELLELSTGMTVKVRRPNEAKLIQNGEVPTTLVMSAVNVQTQKAGPNDLKNYAALQRLYTRLAVINPKVVEGEPTSDDEVSIDVFTPEELQEVYLYVTGGMDGLIRFRTQRQRLLTGLDLSKIPGDETERPVRPQEPVEP